MSDPAKPTDLTKMRADELVKAVQDADAHYWLAFANGSGLDVLASLETERKHAWAELEHRMRTAPQQAE